jgi:membrane-associated protease RseP (regulator of RpoE activity)
VGLYLPFVVPAGFGLLGSFGAITRFRGFVPNRQAQLDIAAAGPAAGVAASAALVVLGFALTAGGYRDVGIESATFADSFLMAVLAQGVLGDELGQPMVQVSSLLLAGWAGLVVNALNCIPAGELDGGRIALSLLGRRAASLLGVLSTAGLAIGSFSNALAFYWLGLVLFLQRGPLLPCEEELSAPKDERSKLLGAVLLGLPLLLLLPFPVELAVALRSLQDPTLL